MKKLIRITESDLNNIIIESVNRIINEIGDTEKGQYMLGRLAGRKSSRCDINGFYAAEDYAKEKNKGNLKMKDKFAKGFHYQKDKEKGE